MRTSLDMVGDGKKERVGRSERAVGYSGLPASGGLWWGGLRVCNSLRIVVGIASSGQLLIRVVVVRAAVGETE